MFVLMFRLQKYYKKMEYTRLWTKKTIMLAFFYKKRDPEGSPFLFSAAPFYLISAPCALKVLPSRMIISWPFSSTF